MRSTGENFTGGHPVQVYNAVGILANVHPLTNVPNGADQSNILIGDTGVAGAFGVTPDVVVPGLEVSDFAMNGAVCYPDSAPPDCVAWGGFTPQGGFPDPARRGRQQLPGRDRRADGADPPNRSWLPDLARKPRRRHRALQRRLHPHPPEPAEQLDAARRPRVHDGEGQEEVQEAQEEAAERLLLQAQEVQEEAPMSLRRRFLLLFTLASLGIAVMASSASATFHLQKIREISPGTDVLDDSYVEIQAYAGFQNFLSGGAHLVRCNSDCSSSTLYPPSTPFTDVANGNTHAVTGHVQAGSLADVQEGAVGALME
jgi:hypothetical protein